MSLDNTPFNPQEQVTRLIIGIWNACPGWSTISRDMVWIRSKVFDTWHFAWYTCKLLLRWCRFSPDKLTGCCEETGIFRHISLKSLIFVKCLSSYSKECPDMITVNWLSACYNRMFSLTGLDANSTYLMYINKITDRIFPKNCWNFKAAFSLLYEEKSWWKNQIELHFNTMEKTVLIITFGKCLPCRPIPGIGAIFLIDLSGISKWSIPPPFYFPNEKRTFCSKLITELDIKLH